MRHLQAISLVHELGIAKFHSEGSIISYHVNTHKGGLFSLYLHEKQTKIVFL
jgi:hypothetical protein